MVVEQSIQMTNTIEMNPYRSTALSQGDSLQSELAFSAAEPSGAGVVVVETPPRARRVGK